MAVFDFSCDKCGFTDEYIVTIGLAEGKEPEKCPKCQDGKMKKIFSLGQTVGIDFIGPGFYINDHGTHAWKKRLSQEDQVKCLTPDHNGQYKDPY